MKIKVIDNEIEFPELYFLAKVTEAGGDGRIKVQFLNDSLSHDDWLSCNQTVYGETSEGLHTKMAVNDWVVISFLDYPEQQKPFVLGKLQTTGDRITVSDDTVIKYNDITVKFENNKITFENANAPFQEIVFGGLQLFNFLAGLQCVGNLGLPAPVQPAQITQITNAIANSKKITFGV